MLAVSRKRGGFFPMQC